MGQFSRILWESSKLLPSFSLSNLGIFWGLLSSILKTTDPVAALVLENSQNSRTRMRILEVWALVYRPSLYITEFYDMALKWKELLNTFAWKEKTTIIGDVSQDFPSEILGKSNALISSEKKSCVSRIEPLFTK